MIMAIEREEKESDDISREPKSVDNIRRNEKLASKFGGGRFGVGGFSRIKITREKKE